jgi:hypothetical protein
MLPKRLNVGVNKPHSACKPRLETCQNVRIQCVPFSLGYRASLGVKRVTGSQPESGDCEVGIAYYTKRSVDIHLTFFLSSGPGCSVTIVLG